VVYDHALFRCVPEKAWRTWWLHRRLGVEKGLGRGGVTHDQRTLTAVEKTKDRRAAGGGKGV
jgi:hypothetical protein